MPTAWIQARWWLWRARYAVRRKDYRSAFSFIERSIHLLPHSAFPLAYAGHCLSAQERYEEARKYYDRALQISPSCGYVHAQLGRSFIFLKRPQEALDSLNRAFRMQPKLRMRFSYQVAFAAAVSYIGNVEDALTEYRAAAKLNPKSADALAGVGWALLETGNARDAEGPLRMAIELDPDGADSHRILTNVLQDLERFEESIPIAQRWVALRPEDSYAHQCLGWGLGKAGRYGEAVLAYKRALELTPDSAAAYYEMGLFYCLGGEQKEAIEAEEEAIALAPTADMYGVLAGAWIYQEGYENSLRASGKALEINPEMPEALHNQGHAYLELEEFAKAVSSLERAIQFGDEMSSTRYMLGIAYAKVGNRSGAMGQCQLLETLDTKMAQQLRDVLAGEEQ